jgi:ATP-dependent DNA helicase RecQ
VASGSEPGRPASRSDDDLIRATARDEFGWDELRGGQLEAIRPLLEGHDVLCVMPTGAGKSAVYQIAGLLLDGPTVVISPLIALQRDQLDGLARHGEHAVAVNSAQGAGATHHAWDSLTTGESEFLFLAPEQLANEDVVERLAAAGVSLLAVDEAHCVSSWGHDFRPDYLRIGDVVERLGRPRIVALTATAAPPVRAEIVARLRLNEPTQVVTGFDRPNLRLEVRRFTRERDKQDAVVAQVRSLAGSGLVYTATRKETDTYAEELSRGGRTAAAYHAGLKPAERERVHEGFLNGEIDVVVATSAFGMGIDKPDVRFVVHADIAESLDSYYQEIGRAGRDCEPALTVLFYRSEDLGLRTFFASGGPDEEVLQQVAGAVRKHSRVDGAAEPSQLKDELALSHTRLTNAVNLLEQAGAVEVDQEGRLHYRPGLKLADAVSEAEQVESEHGLVERSRVEMMRGYAETSGCRRQFLLGYFGEELPEICGNCDTCSSGSAAEYLAEESDLDTARTYRLNAAVAHREWGPGIVMRHERDRITVLFDQVGYRTLALAALDRDPTLLEVTAAPS